MSSLSHIDIGQIGEEAALKHYLNKGYKAVVVNYRKTFGEIDVIVRDEKHIVFVEVKSVSCVTFVTVSRDTFNPAENIHPKKRLRLRKTINAFLYENRATKRSWRFDVALVRVNLKKKVSRVETVEDVIL